MADSAAIRAGKAFVEIVTDDGKVAPGLRKVQSQFKSWASAMNKAGKSAMLTGAAITTPLIAAAKAYASMGAEMARSAQKAHVSVETMSALSFAAQRTNVPIEAVEKSLLRLSRTTVAAARGSKNAQETFFELGVSWSELAKMTPEKRLGAVADALNKVKNTQLRDALSQELLGKGFAEMEPLLAEGSAGMDRMTARAKELGVVMSNEQAQGALRFDESLKDVEASAKMATFTLGAALAPTLQQLAPAMINAAQHASQFIREHQSLIVAALKLGWGLTAAGAALIAVGKAFKTVSTAIGVARTIFTGVTVAIRIMGATAALAASPWLLIAAAIAAVIAVVGYFLYRAGVIRSVMDSVRQWIGNAFDMGTADGAKALWDKITGFFESGLKKVKDLAKQLDKAMTYDTAKPETSGEHAGMVFNGFGWVKPEGASAAPPIGAPVATGAAAPTPTAKPTGKDFVTSAAEDLYKAGESARRSATQQAYRDAARKRLEHNRDLLNQLNAQDARQTVTQNADDDDFNTRGDVRDTMGARKKRMEELQKQIARDSDIAEFGSAEKARVEREKYNDTDGTRKRLARERDEIVGQAQRDLDEAERNLPHAAANMPGAEKHREELLKPWRDRLDAISFSFDQYEKYQKEQLAKRNAVKDQFAMPRIDRELNPTAPPGWASHSILFQIQDNHAKAAAEAAQDKADQFADSLDALGKRSTHGTQFGQALWGLNQGGGDPVAKNTQKTNDKLTSIERVLRDGFKGMGIKNAGSLRLS